MVILPDYLVYQSQSFYHILNCGSFFKPLPFLKTELHGFVARSTQPIYRLPIFGEFQLLGITDKPGLSFLPIESLTAFGVSQQSVPSKWGLPCAGRRYYSSAQ